MSVPGTGLLRSERAHGEGAVDIPRERVDHELARVRLRNGRSQGPTTACVRPRRADRRAALAGGIVLSLRPARVFYALRRSPTGGSTSAMPTGRSTRSARDRAGSSGRGAPGPTSTPRPRPGPDGSTSAPGTDTSRRSTPGRRSALAPRRDRRNLGAPTVMAGLVYSSTFGKFANSHHDASRTGRIEHSRSMRAPARRLAVPDGQYSPVVADQDRVYLAGSESVYGLVSRKTRDTEQGHRGWPHRCVGFAKLPAGGRDFDSRHGRFPRVSMASILSRLARSGGARPRVRERGRSGSGRGRERSSASCRAHRSSRRAWPEACARIDDRPRARMGRHRAREAPADRAGVTACATRASARASGPCRRFRRRC